MDYNNRALVARREFLHGDVLVRLGQHFYATPTDADYLKKTGRASEAQAQAAAAGPARVTPAATMAPAVISPPSPPAPPPKPSDGLTVAQLKEALVARGVDVPEGYTPKLELAAMLDGAAP